MSQEFLLQLLGPIGVGIGVYAAIKADLATLHERTRNHSEQLKELWNKTK